MKNTLQIIEKYIDYNNEREFIESLTLEEQILYKCMLRDSLSFIFFSLHDQIAEFVKLLFGKEKRTIDKETVDIHKEQNTKCDKCLMLNSCIKNSSVVECTMSDDTKRHYVSSPNGVCPGFVDADKIVDQFSRVFAIPANEIRKIFEERDVDIYGEKHN